MASKMCSPPPYTDDNDPKSFEEGHPAPSFHQSQSQQQMIIVQQEMAPTFVYQPHPVSMTGAIVLSCFVFWCFGWLFGAIAFILAVIGGDSSHKGDITGALRLRNASYGVSVIGILVGVIVIIVIIVVYVNNRPTTCTYRNTIDGIQYVCE